MSADPVRQEPAAFPWAETLGFLMGVLGWPPDAAWRATPREIELAIAGRFGRAPLGSMSGTMNGARLEELMAAFPDSMAGKAPEQTGHHYGGCIS